MKYKYQMPSLAAASLACIGYGYSGYGYLWWVAVNGNHIPNVSLPDGGFCAEASGGHYIVVIPQRKLVVVHRVDTDDYAKNVTPEQFGKLMGLILAAKRT